jgi:hypothetical protein
MGTSDVGALVGLVIYIKSVYKYRSSSSLLLSSSSLEFLYTPKTTCSLEYVPCALLPLFENEQLTGFMCPLGYPLASSEMDTSMRA